MANPVSPAAGQYIDKPFWDAEVYSKWTDLYAPWTAYTPVWAIVSGTTTIGDGALIGRYKVTGKTVTYFARLTWGSSGSTTFSGTGLWTLSAPATLPPIATTAVSGLINNNGAGVPLAGYLTTDSKTYLIRPNGFAASSNTTMAAGHFIIVSGVYETA